MERETAWDLARKCSLAAADGADFPNVWNSVLKPHPTVAGLPVQRIDGSRSFLDIPLMSGHRIVYEAERKAYTVEFGKSALSLTR
jgi:hypothetical protein